MFDAGWRSSPSLNGHPNSWARAVAIVVFPLPEMPVIIRIVRLLAMSAWSAFNALEVAPYSWSAQAGVLPGFRNRSVNAMSVIDPNRTLHLPSRLSNSHSLGTDNETVRMTPPTVELHLVQVTAPVSPTTLNFGLAERTRDLFRATCVQSISTSQTTKMRPVRTCTAVRYRTEQPARWPKLRGDNENTTCWSVVHCLYCRCGMRDSSLAISAAQLCRTRAI